MWLAARGADVGGRADGDDSPPAVAAFRAEIDNPIGRVDHVEVVLDHEHGVTRVDEALRARRRASRCRRNAAR